MQDGVIIQLCYSHLGGMHMGAWRDPKAPDNPALNFPVIRDTVLKAERAKLHTLFLADSLAIYDRSDASHARVAINGGFEHFTLYGALSVVTQNIGLIVTGNTTYNEPFHLARKYASLDHLSGGRIGWNAVTSGNPAEAANFGRLNTHIGHDERYVRAGEFIDVVKGLLDSWDDDAFVRDRESGLFSRPGAMHRLNHDGKYFKSAGPLNVPRPPQGYPVIYQAGQSEVGRKFAAKYGEVVITMNSDINKAREFRRLLREEAAAFGRNPDDVKVIVNMTGLVAKTQDEADERMAVLDSLVDPVPGVEQLGGFLQMDLSNAPLDEAVPDIEHYEFGSHGVQDFFMGMIRRDNLTVRQAAQLAARQGAVSYSAKAYADIIEEWYRTGAADGINVAFADLSHSLDVLVTDVVPDLQRRGVFHTEYRGRTLRESLGLSFPLSQYAKAG